jgi:hypothetical protein
MKTLKSVLTAMALIGFGFGLAWSIQFAKADALAPGMVYELRTYTTEPGRLPALHARFRDHTMRLFEKHGMKNVIYMTPIDAEGKPSTDKLVYLLAHKSQAAAKESFDVFRQDPEWTAARDASEKDGKIVSKVESQFYSPTDFSPMK